MSKAWKRTLLICVIAVCAVLFWCAGAGAEPITGTSIDNLTWSLEDGVLTISGVGWMWSYDETETPWGEYWESITSVVIGDGVTSIGASAFSGYRNLTSVTIPDSMLQIGSEAFSYCTGLTEITIPSSVWYIGSEAFYDCPAPLDITIKDGTRYIEERAFYGSNLRSIIIPDSVTIIESGAFSGCSNLESITLPNSLTSIENDVFSGCTGLTSITIPDGVKSIGGYAFSGCSSLTSITIPDSVTSIGYYAFSNCSSLIDTTISVVTGNGVYKFSSEIAEGAFNRETVKHVVFSDGVTNIGEGAFSGCSGLESITIPDSVTSIGNYAFSYCSSLTSITIPDSVTSIGSRAFGSCNNLTSLTISDNVTSVGGQAFSSWVLTDTTIRIISGNGISRLGDEDSSGFTAGSIKHVVFVDGVTSIGGSAFYGCSGLESITIPDSVTSIGNNAFGYCSSLTSITIPDNITSINNYTFYNCSALESITIPNGVTSIGNHAFECCSNLTSITIPDGVTSIEYCAFCGCSSLTSITIPENVTSIEGCAFYNCSSLESIMIPDSVMSIGGSAFYNCSSLTSITIPDGVTSIEGSAFSVCSSLTSITIPDGVTSIGDYAFSGCSGLESITIPDNVTSIGYAAFSGCSSLESITMPNTITSIGNNAFNNCSNISDITMFVKDSSGCKEFPFSGNLSIDKVTEAIIADGVTSIGYRAFKDCDGMTSITISDSVTSIGESAFHNCSSLGSITIPGSVTSIGGDAFCNCSSLASITILDGVTSIGYSAFQNCSSLTSITIPDSVSRIGDHAFIYCSSLTSITIPDGMTSIACGAFQNCSNLTSITIPDSVTSIESSAFSGCSNLTSITIPDSVTSIKNSAFSGCSSLTSITIPESVTSIEDYTFSNCSSLTSLTMSNTITSISNNAFNNCSNISDITMFVKDSSGCKEFPFSGKLSKSKVTEGIITDDVTSIGDSAFSGCSGLTSIVIPDSVTSIGEKALYNCSSLESVTIPDNVTSIGRSAFSNCSSLASITIPDNVTNIGDSAFSNCPCIRYANMGTNGAKALGKAGYSFGTPGANYYLQYRYDDEELSGLEVTGADKEVVNVVIPNGVTCIGNSAFSSCNSLTSIVIPDGVTSIGNSAFSGCNSLTGIVIPDSVTSIGSYAFSGCSSLASITIPDGVTSIGSYVFSSCSSLESLVIPDCSVGEYAFRNCNELTDITIRIVTGAGLSGYNYNCGLSKADLNNGNIVFTDGVTSIGSDAFYGCGGLTSITIPNSVTSIGSYAFYNCSGLESITIPDGVTSIGESAFKIYIDYYTSRSIVLYANAGSNGAKALGKAGFSFKTPGTNIWLKYLYTDDTVSGLAVTDADADIVSITVPDYVTSIGSYAFSNCSNLESITIPDGVTSIGGYAFQNCSSLESIMIPDGVTSIGNYAFSGCSCVLYANINSDGAKALGRAGYSFRISGNNCNLKYLYDDEELCGLAATGTDSDAVNVVIPEGVTSIEGRAFYNYSNLASITIPDGVTSIGDYAFSSYSCVIYANVGSDGAKALCKAKEWGEGYSFTDPGTNCVLQYLYVDGTLSGLTVKGADTDAASIAIPNGVTSIANEAFLSYSNLMSITIPDSVTSIGDYAFSGCTSLTSITIPNSVTSIGDSAFSVCNRLVDITIPESVTSIGSHAFSGCTSLTSITIPDGVTSIGSYAFYHCDSLKRVIISNSVLHIEAGAFSDCYGLTGITIPESVTSIGAGAFSTCWNLDKVLFLQSDMDAEMSFGEDMFYYEHPDIYCHMYTAPDVYFSSADGYNVYYLEDVGIDGARSITLPEGFRMACGESVSLDYTVFPADGAAVTWTSSAPEVLTVNDGVVTAVAPGTATVTATVGTVSESMTIETFMPATGLVLSETEVWLQAKQGITLSVTGYVPANASADITWSSSDTTRATVNQSGVVSTYKPGDVTITATTERGVTADCLLHLSWPITGVTLEPATTEIAAGDTLQMTATVATNSTNYTNQFVTFSSGDENIATVSKGGLVTALRVGTVTITATTVNGKTAEAEITVVCLNHQLTAHAKVEATCTEEGTEAYWECTACGKLFSDAEAENPIEAPVAIQATGHDWDDTQYVWADDHATVTATHICKNNNEHSETETAQVTAEVTTPATCTEMGKTTYTAVFTKLPVFGTWTETLTDIDALGHDWSDVTYTWADDNKSVTAQRTCTRGCGAEEHETADAEGVKTKTETCEEKGETTYTSEAFANKAFTAQTKTVDDIPALGHAWGPIEYVLSADGSEMTATRVCEHDASHVETETKPATANYSGDGAKEPTCTEDGIGAFTATFTKELLAGEKTLEGQPVPALGHDWDIDYLWAEDYSRVEAVAECNRCDHTETDAADTTSARTQEPTCTEKGKTTFTAEFTKEPFTKQEKVVENIDALGHDLEHHEGKAATCTEAGWKEYDTCKRDGCTYTTYTKIAALGHDLEHHEGKAATCTEAGWKEYDTCKRDGCTYTTYTKIAALGHSWGSPAYAWAKDYSAVTAKQVCAHDSSHVISEKVATTYKVTKKATYTATGVGTYTSKAFTKSTAFKVQTKKVTIDMLPRTAITKAKVTAIDDQVYTGSAIKPALTIKYNKKKLVKGTDYTVSFKNNVKPGQATVTITGKNAFKGKTTVTFNILPKAVKLVSVKPGKAMLTVTWKKGAAITGYEIEYSVKKNFSKSKTVKVTGAATVTTKIKKLEPGKTYYVRIRAYKKVGSKMYYSEWSAVMKAKVPAE